jgi:hypothetical protein
MSPFDCLPRAARPFVRFVVGPPTEPAHALSGVFRFPESWEDLPRCTTDRREAIEAAYRWFNEHLIVPAFRDITEPARTACWFRSDAGPMLPQIWKLALQIADLGLAVRHVWTNHPGPIVYFDEHQIVARRPVPGRRRDCYWERVLEPKNSCPMHDVIADAAN